MNPAFIFARGGSKGLKEKNIKEFYGKPLIAWTIELAKKIDYVDRVIVSTDCENIKEVSIAFGAEVPFLRPKELSEDNSPEWGAWQHAIDFISNESGKLQETFISLPVTAPLRKREDVERCINKFKDASCDIVITASESSRNPYFNMIKINENGNAEIAINGGDKIYNRQEAPITYDISTIAYVAKPSFIMNSSNIFEGNVKVVTIPAERSSDIDTLHDFEVAEFLFERLSLNEQY